MPKAHTSDSVEVTLSTICAVGCCAPFLAFLADSQGLLNGSEQVLWALTRRRLFGCSAAPMRDHEALQQWFCYHAFLGTPHMVLRLRSDQGTLAEDVQAPALDLACADRHQLVRDILEHD
jgi:hypothetical protein